MSPQDTRACRRWVAIQLVRFAGFAGALLGLALVARAETLASKVLGIGLVLSSLLLIATVPAALAHRWRTPE